MSDSSSKPAAASALTDDWRDRWMMPVLATFGGLLAIPIGLANGQGTGSLIAIVGGLAVVAGGISLVDRVAAAFVKDSAKQDRLRFHARTANISILTLFGISFAAFGGTQFATHLGPTTLVRGLVRQEHVESGSRGSHTVRLSVNDGAYKWRCRWDCSQLPEMSQLLGRAVTIDVLGNGEVLGARTDQLAIVEADGTRGGLVTFDVVITAFGVAGAVATGLQLARRTMSSPASAQGTIQ